MIRRSEFRLGSYAIRPAVDEIGTERIESKAMEVLLAIVNAAPDPITPPELLEQVWPDTVVVDNVVHKAVASLRRALADDAQNPKYIATIPRRGYRLIAQVETDVRATNDIVLAVLPFDNLSTDPEMQFFSDGVSEEIIQRLSRGANMKLIGRTSSFQFRDERKAQAAQTLNCSHVLDGSIRRAADHVRISAHLIEVSSRTALWSDRFDCSLENIFSVQDEMSEEIAGALNQAFLRHSSQDVDPAVYDLYLRASLKSYSAEELRTNISLLEVATERTPHFAEAWARLAFARSWLRFHEPFAKRTVSGANVEYAAQQALALDPQNVDAQVAKLLLVPPFGRFVEADAALDGLRQSPGMGDGKKFIGYLMRNVGHLREGLAEDERAYLLDPLDPMCANTVALARVAVGRIDEAVPIYEDLVTRIPDMSYPFTSLLRARALLGDWARVDELLELAKERPLREFVDTLAFVRTKRDPTPENIGEWQRNFETQVSKTGCVNVSLLVYAAHLGLVDKAFEIAETACLGPAGTDEDIMGIDAYRTSMLFLVRMPELRNDPRFLHLCARLGLVEYWLTTKKWPDCADEVPYDFQAECENARHIPKEVSEFWSPLTGLA